MANEIDKSYFTGGELKIPQISNVDVVVSLQWFIDAKEPKFLSLLLGANLYAAYLAGINVVAPAVPDAKWVTLQNKLKTVNGSAKQSPIANYIYYWWQRANETASTGTGEKVLASDNAKDASARVKAGRAWNEMAHWNRDIRTFLKDNATYPEYTEPNRTWVTYGDDLKRKIYNEWVELFKPMNFLL